MSKIHTDELYKKFKKGLSKDELILDVRTQEEWNDGHIPGAKHIPIDELVGKEDALKKYSAVYVHCMGGGRAGRAWKALVDLGVKAIHVAESGFRDWAKAQYPIEKG